MHRRTWAWAGFATAVSIGVGVPGWAQTPAAGGNPLDALPLPQAPPVETVQMELKQPPTDAELLARTVTPRRFDIVGVRTVPFDEVAQLFVPLAGAPVPVARIVEVAREVTALYQKRGFSLSFAYVPPQSFEDGTVHIVVVEGHIARVRTEGDAGPAKALVERFAAAIQRQKPLRSETFERYAQLLARIPGLTVTARAQLPATTDGDTALDLAVSRQPYTVSVGADLRQPTSRAVVTANINDPVVAGGQLSASTLLTSEAGERFVSGSYTQLVGDEGLSVKASLSDFRSRPAVDASLVNVERRQSNRRAELNASYPWLLTNTRSLAVGGGLYAVDNSDRYRNVASGAELEEQVRVRAVYAQAAYADALPDQARSASAVLGWGADGAGARARTLINFPGTVAPNPTRLDFVRLGLDAAQRNRWAHRWGTGFAAGGQYSPHLLPTTERISFGGSRFARGYAAGAVAGDSGWGASAELNRVFAFDWRYLRQLEPYLLAETARAYSNAAGVPSIALQSLTLGVRVGDLRYFQVDIGAAKPLGDALIDNPRRKPRLSLLLSYNLEPS